MVARNKGATTPIAGGAGIIACAALIPPGRTAASGRLLPLVKSADDVRRNPVLRGAILGASGRCAPRKSAQLRRFRQLLSSPHLHHFQFQRVKERPESLIKTRISAFFVSGVVQLRVESKGNWEQELIVARELPSLSP